MLGVFLRRNVRPAPPRPWPKSDSGPPDEVILRVLRAWISATPTLQLARRLHGLAAASWGMNSSASATTGRRVTSEINHVCGHCPDGCLAGPFASLPEPERSSASSATTAANGRAWPVPEPEHSTAPSTRSTTAGPSSSSRSPRPSGSSEQIPLEDPGARGSPSVGDGKLGMLCGPGRLGQTNADVTLCVGKHPDKLSPGRPERSGLSHSTYSPRARRRASTSVADCHRLRRPA